MSGKLTIKEEDYLIYLSRQRIMHNEWILNIREGHRTLKSLISKTIIECKDIHAISRGVRFTDRGEKIFKHILDQRRNIIKSIKKDSLIKTNIVSCSIDVPVVAAWLDLDLS